MPGRLFGPQFAKTNQRFRPMVLLMIYVWLTSIGKRARYCFIPMIFMLITSVWALIEKLFSGGHWLVNPIATILIILLMFVITDSARVLLNKSREKKIDVKN